MTKQEQRKQCLAARRAMSEAERAAASAAICERLLALPELRNARTILSYRALWDEADLRGLEERLAVRFVYPRCLGGGEMEAREPLGPWTRGPFGLEEPDPALSRLAEPGEIDAVLVPCVGFDAAGGRLGHGAGFYDRYLPRCRKAFCVCVAFEAQRLPCVITEAHDRPMDILATEKESIRIKP